MKGQTEEMVRFMRNTIYGTVLKIPNLFTYLFVY